MNTPALDQYAIEGKLGEGGSGVVHLAVDRATGKKVAIKSVRAVNAVDLGRAMREIKIRLEAAPDCVPEHLATIHADDGQTVHIVMEHIEGLRLDADLEDLSLEARAQRWLSACEAVQSLHVRGVIHRDLKPSNILWLAGEQIKILDLGTARFDDAAQVETITETGQVVGTVLYMSPEQARGERDITTATDVYSLGVIGYQLLTGKWPHPNAHEPAAYLSHTMNDAALDPEIDGDLFWVLKKAVERRPKDRYESAGALARDLAAAISGLPIEARRGEAWRRMRRSLGRYRLAAAVLLLLTFAAATAQQMRIAGRQSEIADQAVLLAEQQTEIAAQQTELADQRAELAEAATAKREAVIALNRRLQVIVEGAVADIRENFEAQRLGEAVGSSRLATLLMEAVDDETAKAELMEQISADRSAVMAELVRLAYPELNSDIAAQTAADLEKRATQVGP
ncbi:MAG: serine/threonine protein kinase [Phycisphaerales bacterium JB038]